MPSISDSGFIGLLPDIPWNVRYAHFVSNPAGASSYRGIQQAEETKADRAGLPCLPKEEIKGKCIIIAL